MFRNREIRRFALVFSAMAAMAVFIGFSINTEAGILAAACSAAYGSAFYLFTRTRYRRIAQISGQIDKVLHGADSLDMEEPDEGELSILYSEITKMTLRIREQNAALIQEKMHLADSLADIAHQLRTPLTSANLILSLLANHPEEDQEKAFLREAEELLVRMDWLLSSLLKLSRLDAGVVVFQKELVDVDGLIRAALRPLLIPMELHNIELRIEASEGITVWGDSGWLSEAIQNILKNCMESVGDQGRIEISCTDNPLFTGITIRDSGPGFKEEDLPFIFQRFHRGKGSKTAGYGIGLALCRMIVVRQGGAVTAGNHLQGGAFFEVRFPK